MPRPNRILTRRVSVGALIEGSFRLVLLYFVIGTAWLATHFDTVAEFQAQWTDFIPQFGELSGFIVATVVWPVLLLLPTNCILPWA